MTDHHCHALECGTKTPPRLFVCPSHWKKLPKAHKDAIWAAYRVGQEITKNPSLTYLVVQAKAVLELARIDRLSTEIIAEQERRVEYWERKYAIYAP